jgi:hypothetical protein
MCHRVLLDAKFDALLRTSMKIWPLRPERAAAVDAGAGCTAIGIRANRAAGRAIWVNAEFPGYLIHLTRDPTSLSHWLTRPRAASSLKPYDWKELLKLSERIRTRVVKRGLVSTFCRGTRADSGSVKRWRKNRRALVPTRTPSLSSLRRCLRPRHRQTACRAARCIDQDVGDCRKPQTAADWRHRGPMGPQRELLADAALGFAARAIEVFVGAYRRSKAAWPQRGDDES